MSKAAIAIRKRVSAELMKDLIADMIAMHGERDFQTYLHALRFKHCNPVETKNLDNEITKAVAQLLHSYDLTNQEFLDLIKFHKLQGGTMGDIISELSILSDPRFCCELLKAADPSQSTNARATNSELGYWLLIRERLQPRLARLQKHGLSEEARRHYGRQWKVVGGSSGGLIVRLGEDLRSPSLNSRLAAGAVVKELNTAGTRLHYERVSGSGPMYGWVSIKAHGSTLLKLLNASDSAGEGGGDGKAMPERRKSGSSARRTKTPPCAAGEEDDDRRRAERRKHNVWDPTEAPPPFDGSEDEADDRTEAEQPKRGAMAGRRKDPDSSRCQKKRVSFEDEISPRIGDTAQQMPFSSEASTAVSEGSPRFSSSDDCCSDGAGEI